MLPRRARPMPIDMSTDEGWVEVERSMWTELPGQYGIWVNNGRGHLRVGEILGDPSGGDPTRIRRELLAFSGDTDDVRSGCWTGHIYSDAHQLPLNWDDVTIPMNGVARRAWLTQPPAHRGGEGLWIIHIHGMKSSRASALGGVASTLDLDATHLVPSYYGVTEPDQGSFGGQWAHAREGLTFGIRETQDICAAVDFAQEHGARRIVLIGWSMGAQIALAVANDPRYQSAVDRLVLVGPTLSWREMLDTVMGRTRLPRVLQRIAIAALGCKLTARLAGMAVPARLGDVEWARPARANRVPALVIHSTGDSYVSIDATVAFADANPDTVRLEVFTGAQHVMERNTDPQHFDQLVRDWVDGRATTPTISATGASTSAFSPHGARP